MGENLEKSERLSIVVPCYNEEQTIPLFCQEMRKELKLISQTYPELEFEFVFVDDGSSDKTLEVIKNTVLENKEYVSFSRNFGKEAAIYAGLEKAKGDYVVTMDADLQDPPSVLCEMIKAIKEEGYDSAATRRVSRRGEPVVRSFFARLFYKVINRMSDVEIVDGARDYRIMKRKMVDAILALPERNRFTKGIYGWVGFKTKWIEFENAQRIAGETKWSFWKLLVYALDGIVAYSTAPLSCVMLSGMALSLVSLLAIIFVIVRKLLFGDPTSGWPSMICVILLLGGIQLFALGIIGQYLAKAYMEVKRRPIYIVAEQSGDVQEVKNENGK